jgi:pyruvate-formate lyase-activating enzyme
MEQRRSFLLLDPPSSADFCRRGSLREKDEAQNAPFPNIDLILLSGAVREGGYAPTFIDAQLDRLDWNDVVERARENDLAGVVSLVSSARFDEELRSLERFCKELGGIRCFVIGTIIMQQDKLRLQRILADNSWLDGIILNTVEHNLTDMIRAGSGATIEPLNIAVDRPGQLVIPDTKVTYGDAFRTPLPEHAIFKDPRYCFPQSKRGPVTCTQFSFGCPFTCEFCVDNQQYRKTLYRDVDDMVEEMVVLDAAGFREVYFKDLTFALKKPIAMEFLHKLAAKKLRLQWLCTTRIDVATREMLALMKRAGCYGIEFGVEHAKEEKRRLLDKRINDDRIREVFSDCRELGISTTAFIMLAFEDDTEQDVRSTIRFARSLRASYVSFNVATAIPGTPFWERAKKEGFLRDVDADFGFARSNLKHRHLTPEQVVRLHKEAVRSFYFRPGVILEKILQVRSFFELRKLFRLGTGTLS